MKIKVQIMDRTFIKILPGQNSFRLFNTGLSKINHMSQFLYRDSLIYIIRLQSCVEF